MTDWPAIDFGHTGYAAAFQRGDVYAVHPSADRLAKRPLRLAIAGAGGVAQAKWLPAIRRLQTMGEPVEIVGVADPDVASRDKLAHLAGCRAFADTTALLDTVRLDLLLVLAVDAAHTSIAAAAIERRVVALVEKPLSRDTAEAHRLVELARQRGVLLAAVANKRFSPPYAMAKALIEQGALKSAPTLFSGKFTLGYPYVDLLEGGTVHLLDLMNWFMGPATKLQARATRASDGRLSSAVVSLRFASGAIGTLMTSAAGLSFKPWERVEIFGSNAFIVIDDQRETTLYDDETGPEKSWSAVVPNTLMFDETFGGYTGLLENVLDAVRGLVPLAASGADGAAAVSLIDAIYRAIDSGADIDLPSQGLAP
jgi:predicted dehydrogenase